MAAKIRMADPEQPVSATLPSRLEDIRRSEQTMIAVRWAGVVFALVQVLAYQELPYPRGVKAAAFALIAVLAVANVLITVATRRVLSLGGALKLSVAAFALDILVTSGFVWLYAFDPLTAMWAVLFIVPLEGAIRFQLAGALLGWGIATVSYLLRELFRIEVYPSSAVGPRGFGFQPESISFRMGIALIVALVAGLMSRNLMRQRGHLAEALDELSRIDTLRARLVTTLAHDVRGPLTTIRGVFRTLRRYGERISANDRDELIESGDRQAGRLERLASDLLDLARLERGRLDLQLENVRLDDAVERAMYFADAERRFEIRVAPDLVVRADPARLEQIIVNLATNALRHGAPPFVVEGRPGTDGHVELAFRDHGVGVPDAERDQLFEPFSTDAESGSVGLGLAIVRALTEAQGGRVAYEENDPRGACFRVELLRGAT
ncbi:MAG TPA: ATP-binding protein [Actinomycetota bacterium]|nr:ATP-binding protein [Actinomycetota bacterium]